jgi:hypothetical protein
MHRFYTNPTRHDMACTATMLYASPVRRKSTPRRAAARAKPTPSPAGSRRLTVSLEPALRTRLEQLAHERERSLAYVLRSLAWEALRTRDKPRGA